MRKVLIPSIIFFLGLSVGLGYVNTPSVGSASWMQAGGIFDGLRFSGAQKPPDFVSLTKRIQPAVVNVSTTQKVVAEPFGLPPVPGAAAEEFGFGPQIPAPPPRSLGSGFIIDQGGMILTNYHVVENAEKIMVQLADKRAFEAKVVGKDKKTDVAIIKIDANERLPTAALGNSDRLEVGEWVLALGNPFGLDNSVTFGIVSAKGRHIGAGPYDSFIQTDASINPGNSGGPLVNLRGEVIGINMAIVSQTGGNVGIGFATPINMIKEMLPQLRAHGKVKRGWVGMAVQPVTPELAGSLGMQKPHGALVSDVAENGPAEHAGIRKGDIITEYDGRHVDDAGALPLMVARSQLDKKVQVKVLRENQVVALDITIKELREPGLEGQLDKIG